MRGCFHCFPGFEVAFHGVAAAFPPAFLHHGHRLVGGAAGTVSMAVFAEARLERPVPTLARRPAGSRRQVMARCSAALPPHLLRGHTRRLRCVACPAIADGDGGCHLDASCRPSMRFPPEAGSLTVGSRFGFAGLALRASSGRPLRRAPILLAFFRRFGLSCAAARRARHLLPV